MKKIATIVKTSLISLALSLTLAVFFSANTLALINNTNSKNEACKGISLSQNASSCAANAGATADSLLATILNILSIVAGAIAVIMIIIGGLKYITSQGEAANVSAAKNTVLYAVVGLIIVALAQIIVRFVLQKV